MAKLKRKNARYRSISVTDKYQFLIERSIVFCKENNITFTDLVMNSLIEYLSIRMGSVRAMYVNDKE